MGSDNKYPLKALHFLLKYDRICFVFLIEMYKGGSSYAAV